MDLKRVSRSLWLKVAGKMCNLKGQYFRRIKKGGHSLMATTKYGKYFLHNPTIESTSVKHQIVCQGSKIGFDGLMKNY